mmetsp:Transcript_22973/g.41701  ORF Transcript_22973/g.41701 Transcript_22973/m.41701 type:complete len:90 (-) Transcript_22973:157-426(-)
MSQLPGFMRVTDIRLKASFPNIIKMEKMPTLCEKYYMEKIRYDHGNSLDLFSYREKCWCRWKRLHQPNHKFPLVEQCKAEEATVSKYEK